jgi:hypothetical protein
MAVVKWCEIVSPGRIFIAGSGIDWIERITGFIERSQERNSAQISMPYCLQSLVALLPYMRYAITGGK